ncbi:MAG TPA: hypothetical protein VGG79_26130 [Roseiarcus sp.]|jgi:hypothetical protein
MVLDTVPAPGKRSTARGMVRRRQRIFVRLREGSSYEETAAAEGVTRERVRQIVSKVLRNRSVDSAADHAKLQLARLAPLMELGAEAVAAGDVTAISPYLKVLDRLDRYQTIAVSNVAYDDEARKKLMDKINRVVANLTAGKAAPAPQYPATPAALPAGAIEAEAAADPAGPGEAQSAEPYAAPFAEPFAWG